MANPQIENGHTRIANEIMEQIVKTNLNGTQFRILITLWRFTYGFGRKEHEMSISFIAKAINASRSQVDRELASLIERKIIFIVSVGPRGARIMMFNKDYEEWKDCSSNRRQSSPKIIPKKTKTKKPKVKYEEDNTFFKMANYFHKKVVAVAEEAGVQHLVTKANLQKWSDDMRKLIEIDGVEKRLAKDVMDWVTTDDFWKTNVLSAKKLREKFGELAIKMKSSQKPKQSIHSQKPDPRDKELEFHQWVQEGNDPDEFDWGKSK